MVILSQATSLSVQRLLFRGKAAPKTPAKLECGSEMEHLKNCRFPVRFLALFSIELHAIISAVSLLSLHQMALGKVVGRMGAWGLCATKICRVISRDVACRDCSIPIGLAAAREGGSCF